MILTTCAACAAPLAHNAPRCVRCKVRYCDSTCQHDHWRRGHKQMCKKIHRGGNAEQYNANKKYKEAVAVAAKACADDTKGQTCYICTQALHWKTKEGLVRGCACRGTAGFAHVSCLAEQAKILMDEVEANNLGEKARNGRWQRWHTCSLCEQLYHGTVACALGWACWKTYVGRPETEETRLSAMTALGNGLGCADRHEERLGVLKAQLATYMRVGVTEAAILDLQTNMTFCYEKLGRNEDGIQLSREVYARSMAVRLPEGQTYLYALNLSVSLINASHHSEAKSFLRELLPKARRVLGAENMRYIKLRFNYASCLYQAISPHHVDGAARDDLVESVTIFEDLLPTARRVLGPAHPFTESTQENLKIARAKLQFWGLATQLAL